MKTKIATLLSILALTGCSTIMPVNPITGNNKNGVKELGTTSSLSGFFDYAKNTWGREKPQQIHISEVKLKLNMPSHIVMQKSALGAEPIITNSDKREALLAAKGQMMVLEQGLRTKFEEKARAYGLTVTAMAADIINVNITSIHSYCEAYKGCKTRLGILVKVTNVEQKEVWRYEGALEQTQIREVVNQPLFEAFADELLNAMELDGLVSQN